MEFKENFAMCRRAGVPIVGVETTDPAATGRVLMGVLNGKKAPAVSWDIVNAANGLNMDGKAWIDGVSGGQDARIATGNAVEFLSLVTKVPENSLIVMLGAGLLFGEAGLRVPFSQAVWNLRDVLKVNGSTLVLLGSLGWRLPVELVGDVVMLEDGLPGDEEVSQIITDIAEEAAVTCPDNEKALAVDAVAGLSAFAVEQSVALSVSKAGIDLKALWERKRKAIEQTPGLSVWRGGETFKDIAGYLSVKSFLGKLFDGAEKPRCIVWVDEVEKHFAGNAGDLSGVTQEMTGALCAWWQNTAASGVMLYGVAGSGKSTLAKAAGAACGCPTVALDFSGLKGGIIGQSGSQLRGALAAIDAMGRGRVLVLSTCNGVTVLAPEMRRRLGSLGIFFFDLPTSEERAGIWMVWLKKCDLVVKGEHFPDDEGWTGAEISQCCIIARKLGISVHEAAKWVVPVSRSAADVIENQRRQASGKFLSTSGTGVYRYETEAVAAGGRRINKGD